MTKEEVTKLLNQEYDLQFMNPYTALDVVAGFKEYCEVHHPEFFFENGNLDTWETDLKEFETGKTKLQCAYDRFYSKRDDFLYSMEKAFSDNPRRFIEEVCNSIYKFTPEFAEAYCIENGIEYKVNECSPGYAINMILCKFNQGAREVLSR